MASGVSNSTMSGASRFQSRTVLGKNDIFLLSIREDGIWNDLLCDFLVFRPGGISLFSLLMAISSLSILYSITSLASFLLSASGMLFSSMSYTVKIVVRMLIPHHRQPVYLASHVVFFPFINYPDKLKKAQVTPLYKKNDPLLKANYRPVSVLCIFSKIFEKILEQQLSDFF